MSDYALKTKAGRVFFKKPVDVMELPDLVRVQIESYNWFFKEGLNELFEEISPIQDWTGKAYELHMSSYELDEPKITEETARSRNATFEAALRAKVRLVNKQTNEIKEQEVFLGEFPIMTDRGTFVINGVERVVVSQLIRSPGAFFTAELSKGVKRFGAKIIPNRGAWLEFETDSKGAIMVKIDRKRKVAATSLLRAFGLGSNQEIINALSDVDTDPKFSYVEATLARDVATSEDEGFVEVYKRVRPGDMATADNARSLIEAMFFNFDRYDYGRVGRFKINQRLGLEIENNKAGRVFHVEDLIETLREIIRLNVAQGQPDDIDHLGNRRVRSVGELVQNKMRVGLMRMERIAKDRMSTMDMSNVTPAALVNARPVIASIREFFMSSQLSQFMDQTNPLSELAHKRRLSAMGPGGLSRERAGFDVRDVHKTHYGRICPIATPEGPNIGLVGHLASFARINDLGFIETPYRKVLQEFAPEAFDQAIGEISYKSDQVDAKGTVVIPADTKITKAHVEAAKKADLSEIKVKSRVSDEIVYLNAFVEQQSVTAPATTKIDEQGYFVEKRSECRIKGEPQVAPSGQIQYVDVSPRQIVSVTTSLIPFLEHDDANRALMGTNMQRQAVPCVRPDSPMVGTGVEERVARDSGAVVVAENPGTVTKVNASEIHVLEKGGETRKYPLKTFVRSNTSTAINQKPQVHVGDKVKTGDLLADGASTQGGELALGQNMLVAFLSLDGGTFEDSIMISDRVVQGDYYTSVHVEDYSIDVRETKLGPEQLTRDIPNVGEEKLKDLDEEGIIRIGADVSSGDILVGKISPKGETDLTAEEKLLRAIFGEKAKDVKDSSLYLKHGEHGKVVDVKIFTREQGDKLSMGVIKTVQVSVAQLRKIQVGDKMAGRHGNKGVVSRIVPVEDMPHTPDGTPVDILLNPLGIASRMNIGQILELHLGLAAKYLGYKVATPVLDGIPEEMIRAELKKADLPEDGKLRLIDGRTGEEFLEPVATGVMYILKLYHLVEDKIHQRSIGPYSLVTQQPLGGKAQFGGQRFGEMEVWALEAYGAAHTLQELLTVKSDDVSGRSRTYESIIKGELIDQPSIPESFNVLVKELKALSIDVDLVGLEDQSKPSRDEQESRIDTREGDTSDTDDEGRDAFDDAADEEEDDTVSLADALGDIDSLDDMPDDALEDDEENEKESA